MGNLLTDPLFWKFALLAGAIYAALVAVDRHSRRRRGGELGKFPGNDQALSRWGQARDRLPIEAQVEPVGLLPFKHTTSPEDARRARLAAARAMTSRTSAR